MGRIEHAGSVERLRRLYADGSLRKPVFEAMIQLDRETSLALHDGHSSVQRYVLCTSAERLRVAATGDAAASVRSAAIRALA